MKALSTILLLLALFLVPAGSAAAYKDCRAQEESIKRQLEIARSYGNKHRIAGLERALYKAQRNCTEEKQRYRAKEERAEKREEIAELREEVRKLEQELKEARIKGDPDKIAKRERKLREAMEELVTTERELFD
ncbi:DUF1090 domain-containing protein [Desulfovibrio sp. OttesenSCG-928-C06]|nr:DUF1090 domain-containing protein [Desulfovibrio sp. OttesenSCG-928-C06]